MSMLKSSSMYKKAYKNYRHILLDIATKKEHIKIIARNGKDSFWNRQKTYLYALCVENELCNDDLDFFTFENSIVPGCMNFKYKSGQLFMCHMDEEHDFLATFGANEYSFLKVEGEIVLDIGSKVGDSPIYFTLNGAKNVISVPEENYYEILTKNVKANDLEKRIVISNATYCGGKKDLSLKELAEKYRIASGVLKLNSKNSINKLLSEDNESLKIFKRIQVLIEGPSEELEKKLQSVGFKTHIQKRSLKDVAGGTSFVCAEL
jgi:FkbM family methyltransferase